MERNILKKFYYIKDNFKTINIMDIYNLVKFYSLKMGLSFRWEFLFAIIITKKIKTLLKTKISIQIKLALYLIEIYAIL